MKIEYFDMLKSPLVGSNLIEASAGTGKTYTIAGLFLRLIIERGLPVDKILAVTYTEAATEELRARIRDRLKDAFIALSSNVQNDSNKSDELIEFLVSKYKGNEGALWRLKDGLTRFDEASIFTIHGFCKRMLSENAFESNSLFDTELMTDESELIQEIVDDFWRINFYNTSLFFIQYAIKSHTSPEAFINLIKKSSIDPSFKIEPQYDKQDTSEIEKEFLCKYNDLTRKWPLSKNEVKDKLLNDEGLNRNKYKKDSVTKWIIEMDDYINNSNPMLRFDKFEKFTNSALQTSVNKGFEPPEHTFFNICEEFEIIFNKLTSAYNINLLSIKAELFGYTRVESQKRKKELNIRAFDDLLENTRIALSGGGDCQLACAIRNKYTAALIDEFQDTDPVQYDIFSTVFKYPGSILFLIGDPKQSIYRFRGADIFAYIKASSNVDKRYTLSKNWRSDPGLIKAINVIFNDIRNPFLFKEIKYHEIEPAIKENTEELHMNRSREAPFVMWFIDKAYGEKKFDIVGKRNAELIISKAVAGEIHRLISLKEIELPCESNGIIKPGHIAVLVRKRRQAKIALDELRKFNIPGVLYGSESIFASHEIMEISRVLAAVAEPGNEIRLKAALATDIFGFSGNDICEFIEDESAWEEYLNRFYEYHDLWTKYGFFRMFKNLLEKENARNRLLSFIDGERRMTNLLHCAEILHKAEIENKHSFESLIKWIEEKRGTADGSEEHQQRLETDEDAVKIITIHRSKGLEFPIVFCPFTWEGSNVDIKKPFSFHQQGEINNLTLDIGSKNEENRIIAEREELAENLRLLYVALTRAKHRCYMAFGKIDKSETSAPAYLFFQNETIDKYNYVTELGNYVKLKSHDSMSRDLNKLVKSADKSITVLELPRYNYKQYNPQPEEANKLKCKIFSENIRRDWRISSFSALTADKKRDDFEFPDHDSLDVNTIIREKRVKDTDIFCVFNFPMGTNPGTCIHDIFENLDFTNIESDETTRMINNKLTKYGFNTDWHNCIKAMAKKVINVPLIEDNPDFILGNIENKNRLNELQFNFPLESITVKGLSNIFEKYGARSIKKFSRHIDRLAFVPHRGFMKGFIDLVFQYKGKFYIIDWKSNFLGDNILDYSKNNLQSVMEDHCYILQYHLYSAALHRYLGVRLLDYNYRKHFGGVFYLFVRGVDPGYKNSGIYFDVPSVELIEALSEYMDGGKREAFS